MTTSKSMSTSAVLVLVLTSNSTRIELLASLDSISNARRS